MSDFNLHPPAGATKRKRIVGRGRGSGMGDNAGKGSKGQQSRSGGGNPYAGFEGGQMPLFRRIAHRGFNNKNFATVYQIVNLLDVETRFVVGETVDTENLVIKGLARKLDLPVKILGNGELTKALTFVVDKVSASAKTKIEKAGGKVETP
ncbi:MAG: 50S ribosomal protein L15 [Spirochaetes bacterium GWD1_61_31]|nr:MAG: 50S ribosomal protein L15 [Spirochaetes bacterium GWB1_60_80]OHD29913.1 MAG: 50S ribosomal protein L15 [Spirochaetes bacterium GWC1_61_12]OHD43770.1 MAG: 50S ribosomal protein L15 [Spirochaetes bacterium GWD1_61_31]OHD46012.1 MAG: 50S ribosomal protein L15 [Spirochaetes bacterium GWE1_60_18]OHD60584.1 MAG: 50S ribosomal protein L15 [Spirochaetes bacterium GWF1_60_12]HAP43421.1 50S ribosomal protein L15 [Spirochaetaceae bacterium]